MSNLSYLVNTRLNSLRFRKSRSTTLRFLYSFLLYFQGLIRFCFGGTTGLYPSLLTVLRVSSPSYALSMRTEHLPKEVPTSPRSFLPSTASCSLPGERLSATAVFSLAARIWSLVVHPPTDLPIAWRSFFYSPSTVGMDFDKCAVKGDKIQLFRDYLFLLEFFKDFGQDTHVNPSPHA